jgi:outer membrane protein OmpA-like peptidoglycan-associated protein
MHVAFSLALVVLLLIAQAAMAQEATSKVDLFAGFSWYHAGKDLTFGNLKVPNFTPGYALSARYNSNRHWSTVIEATQNLSQKAKIPGVHTLLVGEQFRVPFFRTTPFVEGLFGVEHFATSNDFNVTLGGGIDTKLNRWLSLRIIQADYVHSGYSSSISTGNWNGVRLQSGLILNLGNRHVVVVPVTATVTLNPQEVFAGEPVKAIADGSGFDPKRTLSYAWSGNGPKVTTASGDIDTTGLTPGSYSVTVVITDNGKGKHQRSASAQASFTVKARPIPPKHPPVISSLTAVPASVKPGEPVSVNCVGSSPDGNPVSYAYTASAGVIGGNTSATTLDTTGLAAGTVTINCVASDDRGLSDNKSTTIDVVIPPPPPQASKLNTIDFPNTKKPWRVDNAAKAILDDVALRLQREPTATAVIVGFGKDSKKQKNLAARRALNAKAYLVDEKGLDPARLEVRTGTEDQATTDIWIVPTGATFAGAGSAPVDPKIKADPSHPAGHVAVKTAKKAAK